MEKNALNFTEWREFPALRANYQEIFDFVTAGAEEADVPMDKNL